MPHARNRWGVDAKQPGRAAVLKERQSRRFAHATMEVDGTVPHRVVSFEMHPIDTPDEFLTPEERRSGGGAIDGARRRSLIDKIAKRFGGRKPIFVLISAQTASGAESLAYDLQSLHRATLIGEKTAGAGNIGRPYKLDDWFVLMLPVARPINPITKTNWEGAGVRPDVAVSASVALDEALRRSAQELRSNQAAGGKSSQ